ncbi:glycosyl transferase [Alloprevotella sp. OH1205_COT-284]|uniref:glycosyltransferase family 32 protein n=1 Tax=Alloprevotella sp. OH1205_COT-284 TaxID=2491043 RepID=UPI000F6026E8|nr:glycosyltransferase [Alloprevotella sp. OH1205_COT-284]RRD80598.1 glycosyl transferase [Alloprevotella sp. OH1205_COT-284]
MIPPKIHYCWLSDDPLPPKLQHCIDSWRRFLPDYEIIRWDLKRFPLEKNIWVRQAFERRKYAFAADYIRLYALVTEGGIYLDSDVEVIKSFDTLLHLPYFVCKENSPQGLEAAVLGAEPETPWLKVCLNYYTGKAFVEANGHENTKVLPRILKECVEKMFKIEYILSPKDFDDDDSCVYVLPYDYFSPKNYVTKKLQVTSNTYSIHHFAGTWVPLWKKIALYIWVPFSIKFPTLAKLIKKYGLR